MDANARACAMHSLILARLQGGNAEAVAAAIGVSPSTISRLKSDHLETLCAVLARAGLKVVEVERICVDADTYRAVSHLASKAMADPEIARRLVLEGDS
jgi:hypothetical protein